MSARGEMTRLALKGFMSELPPPEIEKIKLAEEKIRAAVKEAGEAGGPIALALVGLDYDRD